MPPRKTAKTVGDMIKEMTLASFIETFLYLWDAETNTYEPWKLWPRQVASCELLDNGRLIFWPKARQVGGSQIAAAYAVKVALQSPNSEVVIVSKNEKKAKYFFKKRVLPLLKSLPGKGIIHGIKGFNWGDWKDGASGAVFTNGSTIDCVPTEDDAARGNTSRLIVMDEAGTMQHADEIWKATSPAIDQHPEGQIVVISNSKAGSWFNNMLRKVYESKVKGIDMHFMNVWTDPKRTKEWAEERRTQFDNDVDFWVEYPETIEQMFLKREGYAYPTFDSQEDGRHVYQFDPDWGMRLMYGYDHGFDHFAVFLLALYDQFHDHLYIFDEMYVSQKDTFEVCQLIKDKITYWQERGMPQKAWRRIADRSVFAERGQKSVADLIRTYTQLTFVKSHSYDEEGSTNMLRTRFTNNQISIHPRCYDLIRQTRDLMYLPTGKISDKDNDGPDILRYFCADLRKQSKPKKEGPKRHYNKDKTPEDEASAFLFGGDKQNPASREKAMTAWMGY